MTLACHKGQESGDVDGGLTNNFLTFVPGVYMKFRVCKPERSLACSIVKPNLTRRLCRPSSIASFSACTFAKPSATALGVHAPAAKRIRASKTSSLRPYSISSHLSQPFVSVLLLLSISVMTRSHKPLGAEEKKGMSSLESPLVAWIIPGSARMGRFLGNGFSSCHPVVLSKDPLFLFRRLARIIEKFLSLAQSK